MARQGSGTQRHFGRPSRTAVLATLAVVSALVIAGCTAQGKSQSEPTVGARTATPAVTASPTTPPTTTPPPVTGHVTNGVHTGDLRYFFLPIPESAVPIGDPDGELLTPVNIVDNPDATAAATVLRKYGFKTGYSRAYRAPDSHVQVDIKLARFGSPSLAAAYYRQHHYSGPEIRPLKLNEPFPVGAEETIPGSKYHQLLAFTYQGDVQITIRFDATDGSSPSRAQLTSLLEAQYQRLKTGH